MGSLDWPLLRWWVVKSWSAAFVRHAKSLFSTGGLFGLAMLLVYVSANSYIVDSYVTYAAR